MAENSMGFEPSSEYKLIRDQLDEFIRQEVEPLEEEYDQFLGEDGYENRYMDNGRLHPDFLEVRETIRKKSAEAGYFNMQMPVRVGGGGISKLDYNMLFEHLHNRHPDGFHEMVFLDRVASTLVPTYDDDYQREEYFLPLINGEKLQAFALTEPDHGSDVTWMDSTAERDGDDWVLNGTKCFISHAPHADFLVVHARSSGEDGEAEGISSFFVDAENPGLEIGKVQRYIGDDHTPQAFVYLNDCRVPQKNMIGEEGRGFIDTAIKSVAAVRLTIGSKAAGRAQWMFDQCVDYAKNRIAFGEPIGNRQFIKGMLADLRVDIEEVRWLYRLTAWQFDQGEDPRWLQSASKLRGSELWYKAADTAVQIHGGAGLMKSLPFERELRNARGTRIYDGTDEIQKRAIANEFLGE